MSEQAQIIHPIACGTCERKKNEDYTIGCPECLNDEHADEKDFGEKIAELINHGLSDEEIFEHLVENEGHHTPEFLVARIRVMMSTWIHDPFPQGDMTTYLELARAALNASDHGQCWHGDMDLTVKEETRLRRQLEDHMSPEEGKNGN